MEFDAFVTQFFVGWLVPCLSSVFLPRFILTLVHRVLLGRGYLGLPCTFIGSARPCPLFLCRNDRVGCMICAKLLGIGTGVFIDPAFETSFVITLCPLQTNSRLGSSTLHLGHFLHADHFKSCCRSVCRSSDTLRAGAVSHELRSYRTVWVNSMFHIFQI
jgi:hypothetical protein